MPKKLHKTSRVKQRERKAVTRANTQALALKKRRKK
jgi:hypothetical protein